MAGSRPGPVRPRAAGHSLLARRVLVLDHESGTPSLSPALHGLVQLLIDHEVALRCTVSGEADRTLTYFIKGHDIVEYRLVDDVVTTLEPVSSLEDVVSRTRVLFGLSGDAPATGCSPLGHVPAALLGRVGRQDPAITSETIGPSLLGVGDAGLRSGLTDDLLSVKTRGVCFESRAPEKRSYARTSG